MSGPLAGVRVAEWTGDLAGGYAGFLLSELGADVVRVEPPGCSRAPGDHVLQRGKRGVVLDPGDHGTWQRIVGGADAVVTDERAPSVGDDPALVCCAITAWRPPGASLPPDEALVAAATGVQTHQWSWSERPVWLVTPIVGYMSGLLGALGVAAALFARRRGAPGQRLTVTGVAGAFALNSGTYVTGPGNEGSLSRHGNPRGVYPTYGLYETADGWLFIGALTQAFWVKLMTLIERIDLLADPRLQRSPLTFGLPEIREFVRGELEPMLRTRTTREWLAAFREADIPSGAVQSREEFLRDAEARALGLVVPVEDPVLGPTWQPAAPAVFSDTPAPPPRPAAPPSADREAVLHGWRRSPAAAAVDAPGACLEGIRVLDLTSFIAGPFCPMLLADFGADVVKVESADGDPFRLAAFGFIGWNRGKRSLVLDLKRPEGREVLLDLARRADVLVDNFRAGVMERLGIGWETLHAANPRLVHTSITGYGSDGPLAALPGFDPVFQARSGLTRAQGGSDEPVLHMIAYNDYCAGALGALATTAALVARERTGRGQRVGVSLFRTAFVDQAAHMILHDGRPPEEQGGRDFLGPSACRRLYPCRDGWVCIAATDAAQAAALGALAGIALRLDAPAGGPAAEAVARLLAGEPRDGSLARLAAAGVPAAPCRTMDELFADPALAADGTIVEQPHPTLGAVLQAGPFIRFAARPIIHGRSAPLLGADASEVLAEMGYTPARIAGLVAGGVVGG